MTTQNAPDLTRCQGVTHSFGFSFRHSVGRYEYRTPESTFFIEQVRRPNWFRRFAAWALFGLTWKDRA